VRVSAGLPDFPWDVIEPAKAVATAHPGGLIDLSIGAPVDPVAPMIRAALAAASNAPGYPATAGTPELRAALRSYVATQVLAGAAPGDAPGGAEFGVLPTIGSKELVAWLPRLLGLGADDAMVIPSLCYPTYEVGARLAGVTVIRSDAPSALDPRVGLVWVNSPANPHGRVLPAEHLREVVRQARAVGAVVVSDECYLGLSWDASPVSILDPDVCGGSYAGILAVHSLSKRSNLAGYRAGFVAGDPELVDELLTVRKHAGMIVPAPVQAAMIAAMADNDGAREQKARYQARRGRLWAALVEAGFTVDHSEAGLYLWVTRGEDCWSTLSWLAERGILGSPGAFYGPDGQSHIRLALTARDDRIAAVADRLGE
jgi:succinyldiaminopimelate transaminase